MKKRQWLFVGLIVALIATVAGAYLGVARRAPQASLPEGAVAALFATRLNDSAGKAQSIAQWRGKTLVINFWASWCPPCREEMPGFSRLQTQYAPNGVQFVGIAIDTLANVVDFSKQQPVSYPLLIADSAAIELTRQLGNIHLALPYTVVLGPAGDVKLARLGRVSEQELAALLPKPPRSQ